VYLLVFHTYFCWIFLILKELTARHLYMSFGVKGLIFFLLTFLNFVLPLSLNSFLSIFLSICSRPVRSLQKASNNPGMTYSNNMIRNTTVVSNRNCTGGRDMSEVRGTAYICGECGVHVDRRVWAKDVINRFVNSGKYKCHCSNSHKPPHWIYSSCLQPTTIIFLHRINQLALLPEAAIV
jgi:hypothetical protein